MELWAFFLSVARLRCELLLDGSRIGRWINEYDWMYISGDYHLNQMWDYIQ